MKYFLFIIALSFSFTSAAGEYIIKFKNGGAKGLTSQATQLGLKVLDTHDSAQLVKVTIDDKVLATQWKNLKANKNIEYIVEDFKLYAVRGGININQLREQWAIAKVNAQQAWDKAGNKGSRDTIIAVIDTGADYKHESLAPNMIPGYDFKDDDSDPMDETSFQNPGHGTHCSGIIGATGEVDGGITGLSPHVSIMPLRFLGADGSGDLMAGIKAVDYAIEKGAKIISASWGAKVSASQAQPLIDAVKRASDAGVIFISAAGNDGASNDRTGFYPANAKFENTITVAASNSSDGKPSWSNYGRAIVDLAAPGDQIMSTVPNNKYQNLSGTSMATPLVSGLVGLLASQMPEITGAQARSLIQTTGANVNIETACNCRIDAGAAMTALKQNTLTVVPAAATIAPNGTLQFSGFLGTGPYTFTSSNPSIADIDANGMLTAKSKGDVKVTVTDSAGHSAQSLDIRIADKSTGSDPGNPPPGNPGEPGQCPLDPQTCELLCQIMPDMPWCQN
ncbi:MAG: S8 family serine peptidase [Bdellovibrionales bacterium]|nr:S8 family serine peptidase [Bdellovibrionales bacterium]